jgi:hypothetical protein
MITNAVFYADGDAEGHIPVLGGHDVILGLASTQTPYKKNTGAELFNSSVENPSGK